MILSDIPTQNVLYIENGTPKSLEDLTFGANIHSLYKHSFFMNLPMGEFAKSKINRLFEQIRSEELNKAELDEIKTEIKLIGEPLLKNELMKLYSGRCSIDERILYYEEELSRLKKRSQDDKNKN